MTTNKILKNFSGPLRTLTFENGHQEVCFHFDETTDFISIYEIKKIGGNFMARPATLSKEWTENFVKKALVLLKANGVCEFRTPLGFTLNMTKKDLTELQNLLMKG